MQVVGYFIDYLTFEKGISGFEQITISLKNSKFRNSFYPNTDSAIPPSASEKYINEFFLFIYDRHGIKNDKLKIY